MAHLVGCWRETKVVFKFIFPLYLHKWSSVEEKQKLYLNYVMCIDKTFGCWVEEKQKLYLNILL